ncbi:hypothetical protein H632_c688p0 [Helicosporidium sp. ATCC 50920]|nr:hypothetical protein H632_c688p0 [Helicosporidium sp. ATCC 50920]|eukprot:KDD75430.1 hypothetical protein H632_c688p0 [Helicosporidium sp. ATCC 50920]
MASTLHYLLFQDPDLLDIVDEEWEREELADEDVPLPNGVMFPSDEDTELGEAVDDGWLDLGLASLR